MIELVKAFLIHFTYLALVCVLIAAGMGVPIPEDVPLIFSGYLCHPTESPINDVAIPLDPDGNPETQAAAPVVKHKIPKWYLMMIAGMVGVLGGDSIVFVIGRRGIDSDNFAARHLRKVMNSKRRERMERHFLRHGNLTVFVGRFMPGARSIVFAMAGLSKMSYRRFLFIDGIAALFSVPIFIGLGYIFAANITQLFKWIDRVKMILGPILLLAAVVAVIVFLVRRRRRRMSTTTILVAETKVLTVETAEVERH